MTALGQVLEFVPIFGFHGWNRRLIGDPALLMLLPSEILL